MEFWAGESRRRQRLAPRGSSFGVSSRATRSPWRPRSRGIPLAGSVSSRSDDNRGPRLARRGGLVQDDSLEDVQKNQARDRLIPCLLPSWRLLRGENLIVGRDVVAAYMLVFVLAGQRTFAQDRTAGWVLPHLDHLPRYLDLRELLRFGRVLQRDRKSVV